MRTPAARRARPSRRGRRAAAARRASSRAPPRSAAGGATTRRGSRNSSSRWQPNAGAHPRTLQRDSCNSSTAERDRRHTPVIGLPRSSRVRRGPRMHVADVTLFFAPHSGGVKRYLLAKHRHYQRQPGLRHSLLVPGARDGEIAPDIHTLASPRIPFGGGYRLPLWPARFRRALCELAPDLIEAGDPYQLAFAALDAADALGVPAVAFAHSDLPRLLAGRCGRLVGAAADRYLRSLYNRFDLVLAPSRAVAQRLADGGVERIVVQPLGVDGEVFHPARHDPALRAELGLPADTRLLIFAGRMAREKQIPLLLETFAALGARHHLLLVGGERRGVARQCHRAALRTGRRAAGATAGERRRAGACRRARNVRPDRARSHGLRSPGDRHPRRRAGRVDRCRHRRARRAQRRHRARPRHRGALRARSAGDGPRRAPPRGADIRLVAHLRAANRTLSAPVAAAIARRVRAGRCAGRAMSGALCIALHDVAPATWPHCARWLDLLDALGAPPLTLLVVPNFHGRGRIDRDPAFCRAIERRLAGGDELALHGYDHRDAAPAPRGARAWWRRRVLTAGEGEFAALDEAQARERIRSEEHTSE